jgi:FixJ family two-component response regulator
MENDRGKQIFVRTEQDFRAAHRYQPPELHPSGRPVLARDPKIAVIDDDELVREGVAWLIRSLGYDVDKFASAEEYLASDGIDNSSCIILDVRMPGMTGIDLQERLIDNGLSIPIIFMSALSTQALTTRVTQKIGTIGLLSKPFNAESLIEYLNRALKWKSEDG